MIPISRQPAARPPLSGARINERHWLARDLAFVHSGHQAFVFGRPIPDVETLHSSALGGTFCPPLTAARGWVPDGANYVEYLLGGVSGLDVPITLSVWWVGINVTVTDGLLAVRRASGSAGGFALRRSSSEIVTGVTMTSAAASSTCTAPAAFVANRWQHAAAVFAAADSRKAYADGAGGTVQTTTRAAPSDIDRVMLCGTLDATPEVALRGPVTGVALPLVIARALSDDEIARLYEEQRSNPWNLFAERRIWVPVSAAGGSDVSVNLTGSTVTASAGALTSAVAQSIAGAAGAFSAGTLISAVSQSIAGSTASFSAGTIASAAAYTLAGQAVTTAAGTSIPAVVQTLVGAAITSAQGAVSANIGGDVSVNLSGASSTLSAGSLLSAVAQSVSGAAVTLSTGTLVSAVEQALSGAVGAFSAGSITAAAAYTLAGQEVTPAAGTIIPAVEQPLTGTAITSAQGSISTSAGGDVSVNLSGQALTASHGTLAGTVAYNLSGVAVTAAAGTLDISVAQVLSGLSITSAAGTITHTGGDSATYSILPPYIAVYFWKRTA